MDLNQQEFQQIIFPSTRKEDWKEILPRKLIDLKPGIVILDTLDWLLSCKDLQRIKILLDKAGLKIKLIQSNIPETIVSASCLGYQTLLNLQENKKLSNIARASENEGGKDACLRFHQGTLRSGENIETEGDLLLLGDVNPGAKVCAGGNVMIWGRLRGNAHAGKSGDKQAKIVALQLWPLQLRIANQVARGPEEKPEEGLAEEAVIKSNQIVIQPAKCNPFTSE